MRVDMARLVVVFFGTAVSSSADSVSCSRLKSFAMLAVEKKRSIAMQL